MKGDVTLHLKSLKAEGFKSFADKIELDFQGGITAIVGPNGSGKSNISDAIRWKMLYLAELRKEIKWVLQRL